MTNEKSTRDDFLIDVKRALAKRAGNHCSFPGCDAPTSGPSDEGPMATSNSGHAAHIAAASGGRGARRYAAVLTPEFRKSIENGLWCCAKHATVIDTDEQTYSITMLRQWKVLAEERADIRHIYGRAVDAGPYLTGLGLAPDTIAVSNDRSINRQIGDAVDRAWIAGIWGKQQADAIRDLLIEHALNAFFHGGATDFSIRFERFRIIAIDNGRAFDINALATASGSDGGGQALMAALTKLKLHSIACQAKDKENQLTIPLVKSVDDLLKFNPCALQIMPPLPRRSLSTNCSRIFLVADMFASFSDRIGITRAVENATAAGQIATLILPRASEGVIDAFQSSLPNVEVRGWD